MDFRSANAQPTHQPAPAGGVATAKTKKGLGSTNIWIRSAAVALMFCLTILVVAAIAVIAFDNTSGSGAEQGKYVNTKQYQAVFLTNGQVYFGNITNVSSDYLRLQNIYYLTQNTSTTASGTTTSNGNYTLVKLGCQQIHDPIDEMVVERSQVSFWENLNDSGKVVTSINQFKKQNPNGPDCSQVSNQTQASSNSGNTTTGTNTNTTKP